MNSQWSVFKGTGEQTTRLVSRHFLNLLSLLRKEVPLLSPLKRDVVEKGIGKDDRTQIPKWNRKNIAETRNGRSTYLRGTVLERSTLLSPRWATAERGWGKAVGDLASPDNTRLLDHTSAADRTTQWYNHAGKWKMTASSKRRQAIPIQIHNYTLWHFKERNGDLFSHQNL